jgi:hemoglobin
MKLAEHPKEIDVLEVGGTRLSFKDIRSVVESFYTDVAKHEILKVPFSSVKDWPHHIERLTHFWWLRFGGTPYMEVQYNPVFKHLEAGFNAEFLTEWLQLFKKTLDSTLTSEQATVWLELAQRMGQALSQKNEMAKAHLGQRP